jgi:hypothetical protein
MFLTHSSLKCFFQFLFQEAEEAAAMEEFKLNHEGRFREEDEDQMDEEEAPGKHRVRLILPRFRLGSPWVR